MCARRCVDVFTCVFCECSVTTACFSPTGADLLLLNENVLSIGNPRQGGWGWGGLFYISGLPSGGTSRFWCLFAEDEHPCIQLTPVVTALVEVVAHHRTSDGTPNHATDACSAQPTMCITSVCRSSSRDQCQHKTATEHAFTSPLVHPSSLVLETGKAFQRKSGTSAGSGETGAQRSRPGRILHGAPGL